MAVDSSDRPGPGPDGDNGDGDGTGADALAVAALAGASDDAVAAVGVLRSQAVTPLAESGMDASAGEPTVSCGVVVEVVTEALGIGATDGDEMNDAELETEHEDAWTSSGAAASVA